MKLNYDASTCFGIWKVGIIGKIQNEQKQLIGGLAKPITLASPIDGVFWSIGFRLHAAKYSNVSKLIIGSNPFVNIY